MDGSRRVEIGTWGGPEVVRMVRDAGPPQPGAGQLRVRVEASTVNATDAVIRKGLYPLLRDRPPLTLSYDLVGVVDRVGPGVAGGAVGTRVAALVQVGGNADHALVPAGSAVPVPTSAPAGEAAALVLGWFTALQVLHLAGVGAGHRLLVHGGSGAVGTALLQLARLRGAEVVATASAAKLAHVRAQGAVALDRRDPGLARRLRQLGRFDAVVDPLGPGSARRSFGLLRRRGTLVTLGTLLAAGRIPRRTPAAFLRFGTAFGMLQAGLAIGERLPGERCARFYGVVDSVRADPARQARDLTHLFGLLAAGVIARW